MPTRATHKENDTMTGIIFHESYGAVSRRQLAAYRKHNVSPSDHQALVEVYGESDHETITLAVKHPSNHGRDSSNFSVWVWANKNRS
jgi:hypothetical protein